MCRQYAIEYIKMKRKKHFDCLYFIVDTILVVYSHSLHIYTSTSCLSILLTPQIILALYRILCYYNHIIVIRRILI